MRRKLGRSIRTSGCLLLALLASAVLGVGSAWGGVSPDRLGINTYLGPTDLSMASAAGVGLARMQLIEGQNADKVVASLAAAHLRLYPTMGLPTLMPPAVAAIAMAQYVSAFARRYGAGGTFWSQNPQLPYLPVQSYEIGNEPNLPSYWVQDGTHLHWSDPSSYAGVYEAARAALHRVDPTGIAVVGGLGDSGRDGVDISQDEQWLAALTSGGVDAVGFHPYTFFVNSRLMWSDTEQLRRWMDANGMGSAPIDISEFGACDVTPHDTLNTGCGTSISSADWGAFTARFTKWALCTSALDVRSVLPEYWGDLPTTDRNAILALVSSNGTPTPYGKDYLRVAKSLAIRGCPSMRLWVSGVERRGPSVSLTVRIARRSGRVVAIASKGGRHRVRLRVVRRNRRHTFLTFTAKLTPGHWTITVTGEPAPGYTASKPKLRKVRVRAEG